MQADVNPKLVAGENLGEIRRESETQEKESLDSKLLTFILDLTTAQAAWVREVASVDWQTEDPKIKTWHLFAHAKLCGIRRSVAYAIVKRAVEDNGVEITPKELNNRAHGAYTNHAAQEAAPSGDRPPVPKPNIYPDMVIAKANVSNG